MKTQLASLLASTVLLASSLVSVAQTTPAPSVAHLEVAETLVADILDNQAHKVFYANGTFLNRYGGSWDSTTNYSFFRLADDDNGVPAANLTTCAPLVTHLLKAAYGWNWKDYSIVNPYTGETKNSASPNPPLYVAAIKNQIGFASQITKITDVQPGDIASIWYKGSDEGHTMVVVSVNPTPKDYTAVVTTSTKPEHTAIVPKLTGMQVYEVLVLDSSATGHTRPALTGETSKPASFTNGEIDTRWVALPNPADPTKNLASALTGGVGIGAIGVIVNSQKEVVGYTWSLPLSDYATGKTGWHNGINDRVQFQTDRELVFGRLPAGLTALVVPLGVEQKK